MLTFLRRLHVLVLLMLLALPGCGILTAPIAGPFAESLNHPVALSGRIMDENGQLLREVQVQVCERRARWDPLWAVGEDSVERRERVGGSFELEGRVDSQLQLTFQKEGYYPRELWVERDALWREYSMVDDRSLPNEFSRYPFRRSGGTYTSPAGIPGTETRA
jgi:hypothetical protein